MERRALFFVTLLVALANVQNAAPLADNAVEGLTDIVELGDDELVSSEELLQLGAGAAGAGDQHKTVVVPVQAGAAQAPEPTIETLLPKHLKAQNQKYKVENGRMPKGLEQMEVKRLAVQAAADEINKTQQNKDALEVAKQKEARLIRRIKRDKETIDKVSQNEEYAARKAYEAADRQVKFLNSKANKREFVAEEASNKLNKEKQLTIDAYKKRMKTKEEILRSKERHLSEQAKVDSDNNAVLKAKTVVAKAQSTVEESKDIVKKRTAFLNNIEAHEADARLEYRQAKIQKEFEEDDARKVGMLLKRLSAKQRAVFKFTKSLETKSQRDFRASEAGIEKAKGDYAGAKGLYDKYTKRSGKYEGKLISTQKYVELAKKGVVQGVQAGKDSMAIKNAENYDRLKKREAKDKSKVDKEDIKAKGQNKMMGAAMAELAKAEALETAARKQKELVKQHRITMRTQVEKISFLKNEVRKHKEKAEAADKRAKDALHRLKTMRKKAIREKKQAKSRARFAKVVDLPMGGRAKKKAEDVLKRDRFNEKAEDDNIATLQREGREYYLEARKMRKARDATAEVFKKKRKHAQFARQQVVTAEDKRDSTLAHNKKKIAAINARLDKATKMFEMANKDVKSPAAGSSKSKSKKKKKSAEETAAEERSAMETQDRELGETRRERPQNRRPLRERRPRYGRYRRYGRGYGGRPRYYRRGRPRGYRRFNRESRQETEYDGGSDVGRQYSVEPALKRHPMELPDARE